MKTLSEHNADKMKLYRAMERLNEPHPNGIECPMCKKELWDSNPSVVLTSYPAQKNIHCSDPQCGYTGYRVV